MSMSMAEAGALRALVARVDALEREVKDLTRRLDDFSTAERAKERETLKLKKQANG